MSNGPPHNTPPHYGLRANPQLDKKIEALKDELGTTSASEVLRRAVDFYYSCLVEAEQVKIIKDGFESRVLPR